MQTIMSVDVDGCEITRGNYIKKRFLFGCKQYFKTFNKNVICDQS